MWPLLITLLVLVPSTSLPTTVERSPVVTTVDTARVGLIPQPNILEPLKLVFCHCLSGLNANLFEQIMRRMCGEDVNNILAKCHYDDRLWGFAIRTAETWRTSDRDTWRDPVLALLFRMGSFDWEGEDKLMNQAKQAVRLGTATSVRIWNRVMEIQDRVGPAVVE